MSEEEVWTVRAVLDAAREYLGGRAVDNPRLDSELLLAHSLGLRRLDLYLQFDRPLGVPEREAYKALLRRRGERVPVAYLVGQREFYSLPLRVTSDVLVPRPESELLIELALRQVGQQPPRRFIDLCTGSGCLALALLTAWPGSRALATDRSLAALRIAQDNARRLGLEQRLQLLCGDLAEPLEGPVELVVANPPYIAAAELEQLQPEVRDHEPQLALVSADGGLQHSRRLADWLARHLVDEGCAVIECADQRGPETRQLFAAALGDRFAVRLVQDLAGLDRAVLVAPVTDLRRGAEDASAASPDAEK